MTGENSLFDTPPLRFGRYRVQQQIGVGATGPVYRADDPNTHRPVAIEALRTFLPPEANQQVVDDMGDVIERLPTHPSIVPVVDAGLEDQEPFVVSELLAGDPLDVALKHFGPGAIDDVLPRVRSLAEALDLAAGHNLCHGALHPGDIIISVDATAITGIGVAPILGRRGVGVPIRRPYSAPEIGKGEPPTASSDQFSLAAITYEWLFGELITGPADTPLEVPELPDVKLDDLSDAFTTALAPESSARFMNCRAFVDGLTAAVQAEYAVIAPPVLERFTDVPLQDPAPVVSPWDDEEVEAPLELEGHRESLLVEPVLKQLELKEPDWKEPERKEPVRKEPDRKEADLNLASLSAGSVFNGENNDKRRYGPGALAATLLLGIGVGLAAGYLGSTAMWPQALSLSRLPEPTAAPAPAETPAQTPSPPMVAARPKAASPPASEIKSGTDVPVAPPTATAPKPPAAPPERQTAGGRLTLRSTPSGATVQVDGVMKGVTPLTLSDIELGSRTVSFSYFGYVGAERRVTLSKTRPTQSLDVQLTRARTAAATTRPTPSAAPPTPSQPAVTQLGSLVIESRPPGAAVTVNGVPRGTTPISIGRLPVGEYTVTMRLDKYQPVSMVVRVNPGERARAAATLTLVN